MQGWDQDLFWWINRDATHPALDWLMPIVSAVEAWMPFMMLAVIAIAMRGGGWGKRLLIALAMALLMSDAVVGNGLKKLFNRPRPRDAMSGVVMRDVAKVKPQVLALFEPTIQTVSIVKKPVTGGNSLPSNHTLNLFAVATVIGLWVPRLAWGMYLLAFLVAYSRVYVGAHWPSDLPPSAVLGIMIGWASVAAVRRWMPLQAGS
jgi:undecaprenyl-diphosphatase